jgi:outer membrane protein
MRGRAAGAKREATIAERDVELEEARVNVQRIRDHVSADVQKSYRRVDRARRMQEVAEGALVARQEANRLQANEHHVGLATPADMAQARFEEARADTDVLAAELDYQLAQAELSRAVGRTMTHTPPPP